MPYGECKYTVPQIRESVSNCLYAFQDATQTNVSVILTQDKKDTYYNYTAKKEKKMIDEVGRNREKQIKHIEETSYELLRDHDPHDYYNCDNALIAEFNLRQAAEMRECERDRLSDDAYTRGILVAKNADVTTPHQINDQPHLPIGEIIQQHKEDFIEFCTSNPRHKIGQNKRNTYTAAAIKYLVDVETPRDLKLYYSNHDPAYPTENCAKGFSKFLHFVDIIEGWGELNGFSLTEWRSGLQAFITSDKAARMGLIERGEEKVKYVSENDMVAWMDECSPKYKPILYLLAVSGMRLTQLRGWLDMPKSEREKTLKLIRANDETQQEQHDHQLKDDVILIDASKFSAARKKSDYALFPADAYNLLINLDMSTFPTNDHIEKWIRPNNLNAARREIDPDAGDITLSVTRKFLMGWLTTNKKISFMDANLIECRGATSDIGIKHYTDPRRHCAIIYSSVVSDLSKLLPAPPITTED